MEDARYPLIEVIWVDSMTYDDWRQLGELDEEMTVKGMLHRSVGILVRETDDAIALARSVSEFDHEKWAEKAEGCLLIPKPAIIDRRPLAAAKAQRNAAK